MPKRKRTAPVDVRIRRSKLLRDQIEARERASGQSPQAGGGARPLSLGNGPSPLSPPLPNIPAVPESSKAIEESDEPAAVVESGAVRSTSPLPVNAEEALPLPVASEETTSAEPANVEEAPPKDDASQRQAEDVAPQGPASLSRQVSSESRTLRRSGRTSLKGKEGSDVARDSDADASSGRASASE
jgi:hypothetical protein